MGVPDDILQKPGPWIEEELTSDWPYRKAWTEEQALEHIQRQAGSHFDPQVVEVFLNFMNALHPVNSPALPD
jgi:HD-GYP domain-containing protein (c-di-GMP phosphodiesterase class II)